MKLVTTFSLTIGWLAAQNVGIGTSVPDASARLHIHQGAGPTYFGLLIPNVPLTASNDGTTIPNPATSLLVYVPTGSGLSPAGYYYNSGTPLVPNWVRLMDSPPSGNAWLLNGNAGTNPASNFLGTTDNQALIIRVNNDRAFRIEPTSGAPNIIGGSVANIVGVVVGATISGGGEIGFPNQVDGDYGTIGGGRSNFVNAEHATIGGGYANYASGEMATVAGGAQNGAMGDRATVGGGAFNSAEGIRSTISGGWVNYAEANYTTIGGGASNHANGDFGTIGGGAGNEISNQYATISGGYENNANGEYAVVSGGLDNSANGDYSAVGGGSNNIANSIGAAIGGGMQNNTSGFASVISGGTNNIAAATFSAIGGGQSQQVQAGYSSISGGQNNLISTGSNHSTIGGGQQNQIATNNPYATIPGGYQAVASHYGEMAYATGAFTQPGDAQASMYVLRATTYANNFTEMFLDGLTQRITIPMDRTATFQILVTARDMSGNSAGYRFEGVIENDGGNVTLIGGGPLTPVMTKEDVTSWDAEVIADNANDALVVRVKGAPGNTVRWVAVVRTAELTHASSLSP